MRRCSKNKDRKGRQQAEGSPGFSGHKLPEVVGGAEVEVVGRDLGALVVVRNIVWSPSTNICVILLDYYRLYITPISFCV